ncbi:MAG: hypothetical protein ABW220_13480 [Burkholderiaceae bacterium]
MQLQLQSQSQSQKTKASNQRTARAIGVESLLATCRSMAAGREIRPPGGFAPLAASGLSFAGSTSAIKNGRPVLVRFAQTEDGVAHIAHRAYRQHVDMFERLLLCAY